MRAKIRHEQSKECNNMDLYDAINRRKSCRTYKMEVLRDDQMAQIEAVLGGVEPLFPDAPVSYRFATETKGMFHVKAPHYLVLSGHGKEGEQENAGFIGQHLMLWLNANELGGVWLGASKDAAERRKSDLIVIAFGKPEGSPDRALSEFQRKLIEEITNDVEDVCLQAVRLAPSGLNIQPWYFEKTDGRLFVYRQRLKPPMSVAYRLTKIDMGIALCHYAVACRHFNRPSHFTAEKSGGSKKGYDLMGVL